MSLHGRFGSLEEAHRAIMARLTADPDHESAPRGRPIRELVAASFTLTDPRSRLIASPARAVNYGFAVGELCWYLRGDSDLETMSYYNRRMSQFSDDGQTINSAYGARILNSGASSDAVPSQWSLCVDELRRDPDSRRAVMHINQPRDLRRAVTWGSKDVPCTLSLQLLVRDRRLHMHAVMRSNDAVWGLPYDVFSFTCLQEAFMLTLQSAGVTVDDVGCYHHTAGSLHVYDTHYGLAEAVSMEEHTPPAPMRPVTLQELEYLATGLEPEIRASFNEGREDVARGYLERPETHEDGFLDWAVTRLVQHRAKRLKEKHEQA